MKKIVCEICGSNEFRKEGDYFVCEYCNTKYDPESVKKTRAAFKSISMVVIDDEVV